MENNQKEDKNFNIDGIHNHTYQLLFGDNENLSKEEMGEFDKFAAFVTIDRFTRIREKKIFEKILKLVYRNETIHLNKITYNEKTKQYEYNNEGRIITFDKLSHYIDNKILKKELMSTKRYGTCHVNSIRFSSVNLPSKVVTGYITIDTTKALHSIVEYQEGNKIMIIDWTRNFSMPKDQYVELTNFVELSSIEGEKLLGDMKPFFLDLKMNVKAYLIFREELKRDLERNMQLLSNESSEKLEEIQTVFEQFKKR